MGHLFPPLSTTAHWRGVGGRAETKVYNKLTRALLWDVVDIGVLFQPTISSPLQAVHSYTCLLHDLDLPPHVLFHSGMIVDIDGNFWE